METVAERKTISREIKTAVRQSAVYGLGGLLAKGLGLLMLPFYTHHLTPADYGILEILDLSMSLFGMLLNMGMAGALLRYHAAAATGREKRVVVSTAFLCVTAAALMTFVAGTRLVPGVSALLFGPDIPSQYLLLSFSSLVLGCVGNVPRTYLRAIGAPRAFVVVETVSLFIMLALNIVFIAVWKLGLLGILWSSVLVQGAQAVLLAAWLVRRVGLGFSAVLARRMAAFGFPLIFSNLAAFALNFSDRYYLRHFQSLEIVGIYAVGYKFGFMLNYLLMQPFCAMWEPRRYVIYNEPDHPAIFGQIFLLYSLLLTYAWLGLALLSPEIMQILVGPKFASGQQVIPIIALAYCFWALGYHAQLGMLLTHRTDLIGFLSAAAVAVNVALNCTLISRFGMMGAAWATLLSFAAIAFGSYWFSQRVLPLPLNVVRCAKALGAALLLYFLGRWISPASLPLSLAMKGVLLAVFPVLLWQARIVSRNELYQVSAGNDFLARFARRLGLSPDKAVSV